VNTNQVPLFNPHGQGVYNAQRPLGQTWPTQFDGVQGTTNPAVGGMHIRQPFGIDGTTAVSDANPSLDRRQVDGMADNGQFMTLDSLSIGSKA